MDRFLSRAFLPVLVVTMLGGLVAAIATSGAATSLFVCGTAGGFAFGSFGREQQAGGGFRASEAGA